MTTVSSKGQSERNQKTVTVLRSSKCEYKMRQIQADGRAHTNHCMVLVIMVGRDLNCSPTVTGFYINVIRERFKD